VKKSQRLTLKRTTPCLQIINPAESGDAPDLYGFSSVSGREAQRGGRKLVTISHDREKGTFFVNIPPGVLEGTTLRLEGMGRRKADDVKGDLYLTVQIQ
jgi:DnaJ-class molecular chaperone